MAMALHQNFNVYFEYTNSIAFATCKRLSFIQMNIWPAEYK